MPHGIIAIRLRLLLEEYKIVQQPAPTFFNTALPLLSILKEIAENTLDVLFLKGQMTPLMLLDLLRYHAK